MENNIYQEIKKESNNSFSNKHPVLFTIVFYLILFSGMYVSYKVLENEWIALLFVFAFFGSIIVKVIKETNK